MEYHDDCIALDLPAGFSFHDRPNYCSWNFTCNDSLIVVSVRTGEGVTETERGIRRTTTIPGLGYNISGPHELQLENCRAVWIESVVEIPGEFYNKQAQIVVRYAEFSALVIINKRSQYDVSEYVPLLESIRVSIRDVEAAIATFVPTREPRRRQDETSTLGPSIQLPSGLSYLQPAFDELLATPPEDLGQEASLFLPLLEDALRQRLQGVSFADAEECIGAVHQELESWLKEQSTEIPAAEFILDWLKNPYIMMEMFGPDEEP